MSCSDSEEPPLLEYARFCGIAMNHLQLDPKEVISGLLSPDACISDLNESFTEDDRSAQVFVKVVHSEKLPSSRASGKLLSSIIRLQNEYMDPKKRNYASKPLPDRHRAEQLKIFSPILRQNTSCNLLPLPSLPLLDILEIHAPLEKLNDEYDEGLPFPGYYADMRNEILDRISQEKVMCQLTTGPLLQEALGYQQFVGPLQYQKPTYSPSLNEGIDNFELCPCIFVNEDKNKSTCPAARRSDSIIQEAETSGHLLPTLFSASESVSSFMEAYGKEKLPNAGQEPELVPGESLPGQNTTQIDQVQNIVSQTSSGFPRQEESHIIPFDAPPSYDDVLTPGIFFLSIDLIKTHGPLIHELETLPNPPSLMFRELPPHKTSASNDIPWRDVDISLSPRAGVLLASIKDYTQLHLPGNSIELASGIKLKSPFQERVYHTCGKYDQLYIFTLHATELTTTQSSLSVDKRTYDAIASVVAFCDSLSRYSNVSVLNISSEPTTFTQWIINLGRKHHVSMPESDLTNIFGSSYSLPPKDYSCLSEVETIFKAIDGQFLTQRLGLNSFAACFVLYILSPMLQGANQAWVTEVSPGLTSTLVREQLLVGLRSLCGEEGKTCMAPLLGERAFSQMQARMLDMKVTPLSEN